MPYKFETDRKKIDRKDDKRIKLSIEQKEEIYQKYKTGNYSQRKLAAIYNVNRRLIQFIIDPAKHDQNLKARKERGGSKIYYDKDKNTETMKKHRRYKKELHDQGKLV